ncbi:sugar transferase [Tropicibacter naphthalenivorans]|uniref:Putative undecaprenyl-phosphate N-acetylgalactosaminyl 1-phosphate transferase n=1 Tax=Tropicibacter naphthalenivorans TaxID=441103 RepID=A0A0P1GX18_9RHOB|nr:sugar transferase [Tropicibacter naphthalenivorans]CUH79678.1 Putative undecaprenyl-phosphate N-acetylgalactosaminyl 1-phosphate transferase [Tropicibacter naphthalenivorans]SMC74397.1 Sugar transferase involved in LPS biosynthesis (colanic, teichoic acid) [Tropicibacter naphthalenivorans]
MTPLRRGLDILYALVLGVVLLPLILYVAVLLLAREGGPILYKSERMKAPGQGFLLWKFRTMTVAEADQGVSGGDKAARITPTGAWLRRTRLDELPQLWNILRGDISFVGPRPPLRRYVEMFPETYAEVLRDRPGITGLATLAFHRTEERLLKPCKTPEQTEEVYCKRCIPTKARLDILYAKARNPCSDFRLMVATVFRSVSMHRR